MSKIKKIKKIKVKRIKDLGIPEGYSLEKVGITQSLITCALKCWRDFLLSLNKFIKEDDNKKLSFGNIIHFSLDKIYSDYKLRNDIPKILDSYRKENEDKIKGIFEDDLQFDINRAQIVLEEYIKYYPEDFKSKKYTDVEKEDTCTFEKFKVHYKIDGKFIQKKDGSTWLNENKTKGRIVESYLVRTLTFDFQNLIYLLCEESNTGIDIAGVLYNIIRNPQIKPKKNETPQVFLQRLRKDINDRPEFYFLRYEIPYTKRSKTEKRIQLIQALNDINRKIDQCRKEGHNNMFYQVGSSCAGLYSCSKLDACSSGVLTGYTQKEKLFSELNSIKY